MKLILFTLDRLQFFNKKKTQTHTYTHLVEAPHKKQMFV